MRNKYAFNSSSGEVQYSTYGQEYSVSDDYRQGDESDYAVDYMTDPRLTDHIMVAFLTHMDTAQNDAIKAEQASRGRAAKPVIYVRQMKDPEIQAASFNFSTNIEKYTMLRIAHASGTGPTVDPSFVDVLNKLSCSSKLANRQHECLVHLFLQSLRRMLTFLNKANRPVVRPRHSGLLRWFCGLY
jgi:hypothetical protein